MTVPEAELRRGKHGLEPAGQGWFVLNAADAPWIERPGRGFYACLLYTSPSPRD